jgi:hypothetical protein
MTDDFDFFLEEWKKRFREKIPKENRRNIIKSDRRLNNANGERAPSAIGR